MQNISRPLMSFAHVAPMVALQPAVTSTLKAVLGAALSASLLACTAVTP